MKIIISIILAGIYLYSLYNVFKYATLKFFLILAEYDYTKTILIKDILILILILVASVIPIINTIIVIGLVIYSWRLLKS